MQLTQPIAPCAPEQEAAAVAAVHHAQFVDQRAGLTEFLTHFETLPAIGLDTEFVRERTYFARPGLIQASDGESVWLLDPIALPDLKELGRLLTDDGCIKILHSVGEDLEILKAVSGTLPTVLFDTQIAAAMLGLPLQSRYEHLVHNIFGVELPGGKARNNWCARPLDDSLLEYAAQDVIWLPSLCRELTERLDAEDRLAWHREDCQRLLARAGSEETTSTLERVKGSGRLDDRTLAFLQALADWRESQAIERDLPRRFVIDDETLINSARMAADSGPNSAIKAMPGRFANRHGDSVADLLAGVDPDAFVRPASFVALDNEQRALVGSLQNQVRGIAESIRIDPALIASKRELIRLVRGETPDWVNGWRGALLRERLDNASGSIPALAGN